MCWTPFGAGTWWAGPRQVTESPYGASQLQEPLPALPANEDSSFCEWITQSKQQATWNAKEKVRETQHYSGSHLSMLPMNTVMKVRTCSKLSAEDSNTSSAKRRRNMKKSPMFSAKNSVEVKRLVFFFINCSPLRYINKTDNCDSQMRLFACNSKFTLFPLTILPFFPLCLHLTFFVSATE